MFVTLIHPGARTEVKVIENFFKFWWDQKMMRILKEVAVDSNSLRKAAVKPRRGPVFDKRQ